METNNKLREACANIAEYALSAMCHTTDTHVLGYLNQIEGWAKAALAEPVKNCEVGTPKQQAKRFLKFCRGHQPKEGDCTCACLAFVGKDVDCHFSWAQMPYEEGETK